MKTAPFLLTIGISLAAAAAAMAAAGSSGATITAPHQPPPFGSPSGGSSGSSGTGSMSTGQSTGSGSSMSVSVQPPPATPPPAPPPVISAATQMPAEAPAAIVPTGHIELFNGKDFSGWHFVMTGAADPKATWSVADGVIKCTGRPNGYARTAQAYKDYMVTVEWRFLPGQTGIVNTGVIVHVTPPETMNPWPKCIECQGRHTTQGDFWFWNGAACKELTSLPADQIQGGRRNGIKRQAPDAEKPVGEWNTFSVICRGATVTILVNGKEVNKITECNLTSGYIGLQSEGGPVEIRSVVLDPAPDETPSPPKEIPLTASE